MKYQIRSLDPMSVGKICGLMYAIISLLFIPIVIVVLIAGVAATPNQHATPFNGTISLGVALLLIVAVPVLYGVMGFVVGALSALVYNLMARWVGGVVMELVAPGATIDPSFEEPPYPLVPEETA